MRQYHSVCVFKDSEGGRAPLYARMAKLLSEGWGIVYVAESDIGSVVNRMVRATGIEAESYVEAGALVIVDSNSFYSPDRKILGGQELLDKWHSYILKLKENGFERILVMGTAEPFLREHRGEELSKYEQMVGKTFAMPLEAVCCYSQKEAASLSPAQIISILNSHECTLHEGWRYRHWHTDEIVNAITEGLDRSLGQSASELIFNTLKHIYKMDNSSIVSQPEHLENAIQRLFRDSSGSVLKEISKEFVVEMAWGSRAAA